MEDIETPETKSEETFYIRSIECVHIRLKKYAYLSIQWIDI
jgi:hypothetical protein